MTTSTTPITILLADDHGIVRAGLRALLESQPDMEVVAEAEMAKPRLRRPANCVPPSWSPISPCRAEAWKRSGRSPA